MLRRYAYGSGIDDRITMFDTTICADRCFYQSNHQGSTIGFTNQAGGLVQAYGYDAYGRSNAPPDGNPFRYTGRRLDPETGLYYYRARYYSSNIGRFLQTDPIGTKDDLNLYAYTGNDPTNATDPTGLECLPNGDVLNCDPPGDEIGAYTIPRPPNHPGVPASDSNYDSYVTGASTSDTSPSLIGLATNEMISNPTPGNDSPASAAGTRNEAGISPPLSGGDQVFSFITTDSNGNTVVSNLSIPGEHVFHPAVVSQVVVQDATGTHMIVVGESTSRIHSGGNMNPLNVGAKIAFGKMSQTRLGKHSKAPTRIRQIK